VISFLRVYGRYNVYDFECSHCHVRGELNVPVNSQLVFDHGCDARILYIQRFPKGMFDHPRLEEIHVQRGGTA
jgi:hypothetical protein